MRDKRKKIELMERSIGSIFKQEFWSPEVLNTVKTFKYIVDNDLMKQISNFKDDDYKYTHEAVLVNVDTHGLFQFTLNMPETTTSKHYQEDLIASYKSYLENRILSSFENLQTHEAIIVTLDLFTLLYCHIVVSSVDTELKDIMLEYLKKIIELYGHYNGTDDLSISLSILHQDLKEERILYGN